MVRNTAITLLALFGSLHVGDIYQVVIDGRLIDRQVSDGMIQVAIPPGGHHVVLDREDSAVKKWKLYDREERELSNG